jgi:hypothetical protein
MSSRAEAQSRVLQDPARVNQALGDLLESGAEFPLLDESAQSLPYTARLHALEAESGTCLFRLHRALPPNFPSESPFRLTFGTKGDRDEGVLRFLARENYLLYRFELPPSPMQRTMSALRAKGRPSQSEGCSGSGWPFRMALRMGPGTLPGKGRRPPLTIS